jgi:hypothetical protein
MKKAQHILNKKCEIAAIEHPHADAKETTELNPHTGSSKFIKHAQISVEESLHLKHHVHHYVVKMSELDQFPMKRHMMMNRPRGIIYSTPQIT